MVLGTLVVVGSTLFFVSTVVSGDDGLSLSESEPQAARPTTPRTAAAATAALHGSQSSMGATPHVGNRLEQGQCW